MNVMQRIRSVSNFPIESIWILNRMTPEERQFLLFYDGVELPRFLAVAIGKDLFANPDDILHGKDLLYLATPKEKLEEAEDFVAVAYERDVTYAEMCDVWRRGTAGVAFRDSPGSKEPRVMRRPYWEAMFDAVLT